MGQVLRETPIDHTRDPLSNYVYEGLWENYHEAPFRRWVWTLKDSKALVVLAAFTILVTYTQTCSWALLRQAVLKWKRPIRLQDESIPEPLEYLSQGTAISEATISSAKTIRRHARSFFGPAIFGPATSIRAPQVEDGLVSAWFAFFALLNIALFIFVGVLAPWLLSGGPRDFPIVKSKLTKDCLDSEAEWGRAANMMELSRVDAVFDRCLGRPNQGCEDDLYLRPPQIYRTRLDSCIFAESLCDKRTRPVRFIHSNMTAFEAGINSNIKLTLSHRLTCSPIHLERFISFDIDGNGSVIYIGNPKLLQKNPINQIGVELFVGLKTQNEPHKFSQQSSGAYMSKRKGPRDLRILPIYKGVQVMESPDLLHPSLQRWGGMPFVAIHRAGSTIYHGEVDDPFFEAHTAVNESRNNAFYPDREATALGCFEQFQWCAPDFCEPWGKLNGSFSTLERLLISENQTLSDGLSFYKLSPYFSASYHFMMREWFQDKVGAPLQPKERLYKATLLDDPLEQWIREVEFWFIRALLGGIFVVQNRARYRHDDIKNISKEVFESSLCDRVLFRHKDYTNINWIGLCASTTTLISICLVSFLNSQVQKAFGKLSAIFLQRAKQYSITVWRWTECHLHSVQHFAFTIARSAAVRTILLFRRFRNSVNGGSIGSGTRIVPQDQRRSRFVGRERRRTPSSSTAATLELEDHTF